MFAAKRSPALIDGRMDADFYAPLYVTIEDKLKASGMTLIRLGAKLSRVFKGAFDLPSSAYRDSGIPFIRVTQINRGYVELAETVFISPAAHQGEQKTAVKPRDLLFAKGGAYRHCAVVPDSVPDANISQDLIGAEPTSDLDSHYAGAFLNSQYGKPQLIRWQQGDAQPHLSNDSVRQIVFPFAIDKAQAYIGDKVRQAERLRTWAKSLETAFRTAIEESYPAIFGPIQLRGRTNRAGVAELDGNLNPGAFNPERVRIRRYLQENGGRRVDSVASIATPTSNTYRLQDAYLGLDGISSSSCMLTLSTVADDEVGGTVRVLSEGPAIGKLRPYLNKVCYVPAEMAGTFGSTELLCVRPNNGISGWFLYGVLKLESSVRQLNPVSTGSTLPRIDRADVLELMVPWHEDHEALGAELAKAQQAYLCAHRLTLAAKLLVEGLIDGLVSEADLQAAHAGRDADRAVLHRLTAKGVDVPGEPPLFPDLAQLEQVLADAAAN